MQLWRPAANQTTEVEPVGAFTAVLSSADLLNVAGTQQALRELGLLTVPDILSLDTAESTELASSLRALDVTLGDRSRLWELVYSHRARSALSDPAAGGGVLINALHTLLLPRALCKKQWQKVSFRSAGMSALCHAKLSRNAT
jgi:hypothetical protein